MTRIMFVCHGNICRSPTAEFVFKDIVARHGLSDEFYISSSATSTEEIWNGVGNPVYPPARDELERHGIFCGGKTAVLLKRSDCQLYDLFIGMDGANIRNMQRILGSGSEEKIHRLMEYTDRDGDVSDPWYSGRFDVAYRDIFDGCCGLFTLLTGTETK